MATSMSNTIDRLPENIPSQHETAGHPAEAGGENGLVVAIPALNEEVAIGTIVLKARKYADKVLVIDDGSRDNTSEVARLAGAEVISHKANEGKGAAIRDAFAYAKKMNAGLLVLIDGDGQHNPDEIPYLLAPILKGEADMVNGSRFLTKNGNSVPKYRRVGQEVLTLATNTGAQIHITDTQNGFRAFSKKTFDSFTLRQNGMAIESEMLFDAAASGLRITEVPIRARYDLKGTSSENPIRHGVGVLGSIFKLASQRRPVLFLGVPGAVLIISGIYVSFTGPEGPALASRTSMVVMLCMIAGTLGIFTALVLASMQRMVPRISGGN